MWELHLILGLKLAQVFLHIGGLGALQMFPERLGRVQGGLNHDEQGQIGAGARVGGSFVAGIEPGAIVA